ASLVDISHLTTEIIDFTIDIQGSKDLVITQNVGKHPLDTRVYTGSIPRTHRHPYSTVCQIIQFEFWFIRNILDLRIRNPSVGIEVIEVGIHHIYPTALNWRQHSCL